MKHFTLLFLFIPILCISQSNRNRWDTWYFYSTLGLKVNSCGETPLFDGKVERALGVCTISDTTGNLLFYSNSLYIWNKEHKVMPNGRINSFWSDGVWQYQGPAFVPHPGNDSLYYLFNVRRTQTFRSGDFITHLQYSIINKNLDSGRGDVSVKDSFLYENTTEGTAAVVHSNGKDYWIVSHKTLSDSFVVHKLTAAGLDPNPQYFKVGPAFEDGWRERQVVIKFSPNRRKIVISRNLRDPDPYHDRNGGFDLYDFDAATGAITHPVVIRDGFITEVPNGNGRYFSTGAEFSPNSKLLYVSTWDRLYQFDISVHDFATINQSRYLVSPSDVYSYGFGHIQMGSNGKIYVAKFYSNPYLATISNPDNKGAACNYKLNAVFYANTSWDRNVFLGAGLNNCIQPFIKSQAHDSSDIGITNTCYGDSTAISLTANEADSVKWIFGDGQVDDASKRSAVFYIKHKYADKGRFVLKAIIYSVCATDTITRSVLITGAQMLDLGNDVVLCSGEKKTLRSNLVADSYAWSNDRNSDSLVVFTTGTYWLSATINGCVMNDTVKVTINQLPRLNLGNDTAICKGATLTLDATNSDATSYIWSTGSGSAAVTLKDAGRYWVTVKAVNGCINADTINVSLLSPSFSLGNDTVLCAGGTLRYSFNFPSSSYLWSDGSTSGNKTVSGAGKYWLSVTERGCMATDTVVVLYKPLPLVNLGNDTTICKGTMLTLKADTPYTSVTWQNNSTLPVITVSAGGVYYAKVDLNGCTASDSVSIQVKDKPVFSLGPDTAICYGQTLLLAPVVAADSLAWQDGSGMKTYLLNKTGQYKLTAYNFCGDFTDNIYVADGVCSIMLPTAFTPNNDGLNDVFRIRYPQMIKSLFMQVFNRFGDVVFKTQDPLKGWDGKVSGIEQNSGNYAWIVQYETFNGVKETLKGNIVLIR